MPVIILITLAKNLFRRTRSEIKKNRKGGCTLTINPSPIKIFAGFSKLIQRQLISRRLSQNISVQRTEQSKGKTIAVYICIIFYRIK